MSLKIRRILYIFFIIAFLIITPLVSLRASGYKFKLIDGLITNFHLPESTLLMLVAAFIGYNEAIELYKTAVDNNYRFFSYGDTSLLL